MLRGGLTGFASNVIDYVLRRVLSSLGVHCACIFPSTSNIKAPMTRTEPSNGEVKSCLVFTTIPTRPLPAHRAISKILNIVAMQRMPAHLALHVIISHTTIGHHHPRTNPQPQQGLAKLYLICSPTQCNPEYQLLRSTTGFSRCPA